MRNTGNTFSSLKKLIHIGGVALAMTITLGIAVGVSGHPVDNSFAHISSVPQSPSPVQANVIGTSSAQPELMHEAPVVEMTQGKPISHRRILKMVVTAYCPCPKCCGANAAGITASGKLVSENGGRF